MTTDPTIEYPAHVETIGQPRRSHIGTNPAVMRTAGSGMEWLLKGRTPERMKPATCRILDCPQGWRAQTDALYRQRVRREGGRDGQQDGRQAGKQKVRAAGCKGAGRGAGAVRRAVRRKTKRMCKEALKRLIDQWIGERSE